MSDVQQDQAAIEAANAKAAAVEAANQAKAEAKAKADAARAEAKAAKEAAAAQAKAAKELAKAEALKLKEAAKLELEAKKQAENAAKAEAKRLAAEEKAKAKAAQASEKVKVVMPSSNGITRPRPEGSCGKVWAIADAISQRIGQPVPISMLAPECAAAGLNDATTRTQYARWKQFNGVFGPVAKPAAPAVAETAPVEAAQ